MVLYLGDNVIELERGECNTVPEASESGMGW